jgi:hypothetical protein
MLKNADPCGDVLLDEALKHIKVGYRYLIPDTIQKASERGIRIQTTESGSPVWDLYPKRKHDFDCCRGNSKIFSI